MIRLKTYWQEVFSTSKGGVYQSDKERLLWLSFQGRLTSYNIDCFYNLYYKVTQIDIDTMASNPNKAFDIEIITTCHCDRCFVLTLSEILELKEILEGAKVMLELNSILYERLYSVHF